MQRFKYDWNDFKKLALRRTLIKKLCQGNYARGRAERTGRGTHSVKKGTQFA
jgi:hypothetical protein